MLEVHNYFCDGMIIQQNTPIKINGLSLPNREVCISFKNKNIALSINSFSKDDGCFEGTLEPLEASFEPFTLNVMSDDECIEITDILVGEIWLCAGQSNMQFEICLTKDWDSEKQKANTSNIRFLQLVDQSSDGNYQRINRPYAEQKMLKNPKWISCTSCESIKNVSAIAFSYACELYCKLNIPVGIICPPVGGSTIDAWLSKTVINYNPQLKSYIQSLDKYLANEQEYNISDVKNFNQMSGIYNEKIAPLKDINIKGVIWYQGESNVGKYKDALGYQIALEELISSYRKFFKTENLAFVLIQITPYRYSIDDFGTCFINEAICNVSKKLSNVYVVPTYDIDHDWLGKEGDFWHPIHPIIKLPIALRVSKMVLSNIYKINAQYSAPTLKSIEKNRDCIIAIFENVANGLKILKTDILMGFTICNKDNIYYDAKAEIIGKDRVKIYSEFVENPSDITYAFCLYPEMSNLCNSLDIPALPFRTRQEEIDEKPYYSLQYWNSCDFSEVYVCNSDPSFGGAYYRSTWDCGTIFGTKDIRLNYDYKIKSEGHSSLKVEYIPCQKSIYMIGVSPIFDLVGHQHNFENYSYLTFDIRNSNGRQILLWGVHFITTGNKVYKFGEKSISPTENFTIQSVEQFQSITIDLLKAIDADGREYKVTKEMRKNIYKLQFTFVDRMQGIIYLDNFRLHN